MMLKRIVSVAMAVVLTVSGMPVDSVKASETDSRVVNKSQIGASSLKMAENEEEEQEEYTPIRTIADLAGINNNPSGNYILMNDIDMTEETKEGGTWDTGNGWTPLNTFYGTFDGNGYRIIGMHIYGEYNTSAIGLFSRLYDAKIKNLGMVDVNIEVSYNGSYRTSIGAIAGSLSTGSDADNNLIKGCYVTGNINCDGQGYVGGLIGHLQGTVKNCYNNAAVSGNGYIGGIIGASDYYDSAVDYCYNAGWIVGGSITGSSSNLRWCYNCYILAGTSQEEDSDATTLTDTQMRLQSLYVGFDFDSVWEIDPYSLYPYPQLQTTRHERVESLEMIKVPDKIEYDQGEKVDVTGATVKICYEGGEHEEQVVVSESMLEEYDTTKLGEQDIYVYYGGVATSFTIKVNAIPIDSINIGSEDITVRKGASVQLSASVKPANATEPVITYSSSDPEIVKVDQTGKVTGLAGGTATITVTASNAVSTVSKEYTVSVFVPCVLLQLEKKEQSLYRGETVKLSVKTINPIDTTDALVWTSSDANIVDVNEDGNLLGIGPGTATVTVTAGSVKATCDITVKVKMEDFKIVGVEDKAYTGKAITQDISVIDDNTMLKEKEDYRVSYQNNTNPGRAKVVVTGIGYYVGSITAEFTITDKSGGSNPDGGTSGDGTQNPGGSGGSSGGNGSGSGNSGGSQKNTGTKKITVAKGKISSLKNVKGKKAKIKFKKVSGAHFYWIRYSTKPNMKGYKLVQSKNTTRTIKFPKKKKYYVQVKAVHISSDGTVTDGKWSAKKTIKIRK